MNIFEEICSLISKLSFNLERPISIYRHQNGDIISINILDKGKAGNTFCLSQKFLNDGIVANLFLNTIGQTFSICWKEFAENGECKVSDWFPSIGQDCFFHELKPDDIGYQFLISFNQLLKDSKLIRVDPNDLSKVLHEEMTESDLEISNALEYIKSRLFLKEKINLN